MIENSNSFPLKLSKNISTLYVSYQNCLVSKLFFDYFALINYGFYCIFDSMKYLFLFFLVLSSVSCKKGKADITLRGTITDSTFGTSHSGASIKLYENIAGGAGTNLLGNSTVASDGSYSFTFPRNNAESYTLLVEKNLYFDVNELVYLSELTIEEDNIQNFSTTAKSWVNLHFVSSNNFSVQYTKQNGKQGCEECCTTETQTLPGNLDTMIYCINDGNTSYSYNYSILGSGGVNGNKTAVTSAFDTTEILLNY